MSVRLYVNDSSDMFCFHLYLKSIFAKAREMHRCYMFKLTLNCLSVTVENLIYNEDNTLFRSPRFYFRCTVGARHDRAPNSSSPEDCNILNDLERALTLKILKLQRSFNIF